MKERAPRWAMLLPALALVAAQITLARPEPAAAAPGDLVADVIVPEGYPSNVAPSVAFDGQYLYYTEYAGSILHRIAVPPPGGPSEATGHVDVPISGAPSGIMSLAYDVGRNAFWAVGGDGVSIYLLSKTGAATLVFSVDAANDRPGFQSGPFATEVKIAYDRADDTIWYSPDATARIYHYHTYPDALGTAVLVAGTPYIDINVPPNDMTAQCGYSQSSGVATGGANLFISVAGCSFLFEYTKTGTKVAAYAYSSGGTSSQDVECDSVSYAVSVFWVRDGYDGHIRAFEQPSAGACLLGGGAAPTSSTTTPMPTPTPAPTPTPTPTPTPLLPLPLPTLPPLPPLL